MLKALRISSSNKRISGEIHLPGSKSISNRALIIQSLTEENFKIDNLSDSDDTRRLAEILHSDAEVYDAHHAGTTFRFMTSLLALRAGTQILTGSDRMKERPISILVDALNELGANIRYLDREGYPPLKIGPPQSSFKNKVSLSSAVSSQFITSLLLIAPTFEHGLEIEMTDALVSEPYIKMTVKMMDFFGVHCDYSENKIIVPHQKYIGRDYFVESDWTSASYFYGMAALCESADINIKGLNIESIQGDASTLIEMGLDFGIKTESTISGIRITNDKKTVPSFFEYDFIENPDIFQSLSVMCAGLGVDGLFSGLNTLKIKETDRLKAMKNELEKLNVFLNKMPEKYSPRSGVEYYMQEGQAVFGDETVRFDTYNDHRMAMALGLLAAIHPIIINDFDVVSKSFPKFWECLSKLGFEIEKIK